VPPPKRSQSPPATSFDPLVYEWDAWRPEEAQRLLAGVRVPWYVAAGWAIDLFHGGQRREHEDLELAAPNGRILELAEALDAYEIFVITGPREATPLADALDQLEETHQTWVLDREAELWRLDIFREPSDGDTWISRRDPSIRLPYDRVIEWTDDGIPYGRPEIVLLYKAKHSHRERDQQDFADTLPLLDAERRRWLADALARVHPGHAWLDQL